MCRQTGAGVRGGSAGRKAGFGAGAEASLSDGRNFPCHGHIGASHQHPRHGAFRTFEKNRHGKRRCGSAGILRDAVLWQDDREQPVCAAGGMYVSGICGCKNLRAYLRYAHSAGACGDPDHYGIAGQHLQLRLPAVLRSGSGAWDFCACSGRNFGSETQNMVAFDFFGGGADFYIAGEPVLFWGSVSGGDFFESGSAADCRSSAGERQRGCGAGAFLAGCFQNRCFSGALPFGGL